MDLTKEIIPENEEMEADLESQLKSIFEEIGRRFYEENKDNTVTDSVYSELIAQVKTIDRQKDLKEIRELVKQGMRKCDHCHKIITLDSIFCNQCGTKLAPLPEELFASEEEAQPETEVKKCMDCGTELEPDAVFCPNCGKKQI